MVETPININDDSHHFEFDHHFDFDLDRAISAQVVEKLENSPLLLLEKGVGPKLSGIYALYFVELWYYIFRQQICCSKRCSPTSRRSTSSDASV